MDKIRQLRQENNIKNMTLFEQESKPDGAQDALEGRDLVIN